MIEVPPLNLYADVVKTESPVSGLPTITKGDYQSAAQNNIMKYFGSTTADIGENTYDLEPMSYRYFPAFMFKLADEEFNNTFSFANTEMTSKEVYRYYNAFLKNRR